MKLLIIRTLGLTLAAVLGTTGTCGTRANPVDVPQLFPDVPQLAALNGVRPGMSVGELRALRKGAVSAPYVGLMETVDRDTIRYRMVSPPLRQSPTEDIVLGSSRLLDASSIDGIDLSQPTASMDSATRAWRERVVRMRGRDQRTADCFTISRASITRFALAHRGEVWFGVALIEERHERDARGPITFPAVLNTFVTSRLELYVPNEFTREPLSCP